MQIFLIRYSLKIINKISIISNLFLTKIIQSKSIFNILNDIYHQPFYPGLYGTGGVLLLKDIAKLNIPLPNSFTATIGV